MSDMWGYIYVRDGETRQELCFPMATEQLANQFVKDLMKLLRPHA